MRRALAMACALLLAGAADAHADRFRVTTNSYTFGQAPDWMPDGRVAFHDDFGDGQQVYLSALDGSGRRCLTCDMEGPNMVPAVQPGGQRILFHSSNGHRLNIGAPRFRSQHGPPGLGRHGLGPVGEGPRRPPQDAADDQPGGPRQLPRLLVA